jgi:DNA-binding transcriptional LysR family regulator
MGDTRRAPSANASAAIEPYARLDYPPTELGIYALYAPNRFLAAKARLLIDFLVERFGDKPEWDDFA